jgi:predicted nucleic acid-binding protein
VTGKCAAYVFDSFAVLAYLQGERPADKVRRILHEASRQTCTVRMPVINLGEVLYITERAKGLAQAHAVVSLVEQVPITLLPATRAAVFAAAHIKAVYRVSYADAFAIAAAREFSATVVTGDPEFAAVEHLIHIEWLEKPPPRPKKSAKK